MKGSTPQELPTRCISGDPPPCREACPLGLDVHGFVGKIKQGHFAAAARLCEASLLFTGIVCCLCDEPCKAVCTRNTVGGAIELKAMERYCWQASVKQPRTQYYMTKQKKSILIVGGGLLGTACAAKLAGRGFEVTLMEKEAELWPRLRKDGRVPAEVLKLQEEPLLAAPSLTIVLDREVSTLSAFAHDVIFVAVEGWTGEKPVDAASGGRVFYRTDAGQSNHTKDALDALRQGIEMSYVIENYAKVGRIQAKEPRSLPVTFHPNVSEVEPLPSTLPEAFEEIGEETVITEAERCLLCKCQNCLDCCEMMAWFGKDPKQVLTDVNTTLNKYLLVKKDAQRQIMSCTQCGACEIVCPVGIDMKALFLESRRLLHRGGELPPAAYEFWMNDMLHANSEKASVFITPQEEVRYLYFPGCQLGASDPGYVLRSWQWMRYRFGEDAALLVECCGAPAHWAGDEEAHTSVLCKIRKRWKNLGQPVIVLACPTCASLLTEAIPEAPIIFLWELIANHGFHPDQSGQGKTVFVFDPCAGKAFPNAKQSVRQLLEGKEYAIEEVPENPGRAQCCGYGGLVWPTNTKVVESIAEMEINQSNKDYITWCSNCRDIFVSRGKRAAHILDILMAPFEDRFKRPAPNLTERRKNRQALCAKLCEPSSEGLQGDSEGQRNLVLVVPPAVQKKMDQNLILEDHIRVVIESAENGGLLVKNPSTGLLTSYLKQGALTYWVQYKREDDGRICVCNVYTHRMSIVEKR